MFDDAAIRWMLFYTFIRISIRCREERTKYEAGNKVDRSYGRPLTCTKKEAQKYRVDVSTLTSPHNITTAFF